MDTSVDFNDVEALAITLTKTASVTDSAGEKAYPAFLVSLLGQMAYFQRNPDLLLSLPIPADPKGRSNLLALVKGSGTRTVMLTGHYDVVQTAMYGSLEPWAFNPEILAAKTLETLEGVSGKDNPLSRLKEDLASGDFLPGRGILDMKGGLAVGISILASFAAKEKRKGNILFLAVPDEEGSSCGMKAAAALLPSFLAEKKLEASAIFNLDSAVDQDSGEAGRAVFLGSVGKTLPFAFFVGKCTHAGAPFDGINPALMAAEFAQEVECNPDALKEKQTIPGEEAPPPTILYFRESRASYDVTTPQSVFCALNVLSHTRPPEEILASIGRLALGAMNRSIVSLRERASTLSRRVSGHFVPPVSNPQILSFEELAQKAERLSRGILDKARASAEAAFPDDRVKQTLAVLETILPFSGLEGPAAVVGFAPPYYPRAELDQERHAVFFSMLRTEISEFSAEIGKSIRARPYFPGISDMSFLAPADSSEQRAFVRTQMPVADPFAGDVDQNPDSSAAGSRTAAGTPGSPPLNCPVLNIGPWGREYHQAGERVHREYSFVQLPKLLTRLVEASLALPQGGGAGEKER